MNETRSVGKEPEVSEVAKVGPEQAGAKATAGTVTSSDAPAEVFEVNGSQTYRVTLPTFDGPLDLLLHLVQKHELNILDIPIGFVALKYVEYIRMMEELSIDIASEYLVMAATLAYLKSRSLLPPDPTAVEEELAEDEEDPRAELIRRLLEYQKYKLAAEQLGERSVLGRDVFPRGAPVEASTEPAPLAPLSLFRLVDAFGDVLKRAKHVEEHTINFERISISDKIGSINELLSQRGSLKFEELFVDDRSRAEMIVTFLALLEMTKLRMVNLRQDDPLGPIIVDLRVRDQDAEEEPWLAATRITSDSPSAAPVPPVHVEEDAAAFDEDEADQDEPDEDEADQDEADQDEAEQDEADDEADQDEADSAPESAPPGPETQSEPRVDLFASQEPDSSRDPALELQPELHTGTLTLDSLFGQVPDTEDEGTLTLDSLFGQVPDTDDEPEPELDVEALVEGAGAELVSTQVTVQLLTDAGDEVELVLTTHVEAQALADPEAQNAIEIDSMAAASPIQRDMDVPNAQSGVAEETPAPQPPADEPPADEPPADEPPDAERLPAQQPEAQPEPEQPAESVSDASVAADTEQEPTDEEDGLG